MRRAGSQPLGERSHRLGGASRDPLQPAKGEPVADLLASSLGRDEAAVAQASEVSADSWLRLADGCDQLADRPLTLLHLRSLRRPGGMWRMDGRRYCRRSGRMSVDVVDWADAHPIVTPIARAMLATVDARVPGERPEG